MTEKERACAVSMVGAAIGALAGYLFFTERGRTVRRQLEAALDAVAPELSHFSHAVNRAAGVATDGWRLLSDALGERGRSPHYTDPHQTSPF